jgi:hypothetical protein
MHDCFQLLSGELKAVWCREDYRSNHIYGPASHINSINFHTRGGFTFPSVFTLDAVRNNHLEKK